ncbi:MAG: hypothetical protein WBQ17_09300 [Rhizomicrobium sp.]
MGRSVKMVHFPKTRLSELAARSGGVTRERAVEEALKSIENLRDHAITTIDSATVSIEAAVGRAQDGRMPTDDMQKVLRDADSIVTMAATFGMSALENIGKSLCDICDGLLARQMHDVAPIAVHIQAIRLAAPGKPEIAAAAAAHVLGELSKVREHYGFDSLAQTAPVDIGPPPAAH